MSTFIRDNSFSKIGLNFYTFITVCNIKLWKCIIGFDNFDELLMMGYRNIFYYGFISEISDKVKTDIDFQII